MTRAFAYRSLAACLLLLMSAPVDLAFGQPGRPQAEGPEIDPDADEVLREFSDYVQGLDSFRVKFQTTLAGTEKHSIGSTILLNYTVAAQRPNKFAMLPKKKDRGMTVVCDGKHLTTYSPTSNQYIVEPAPSSLDGVLDFERLSLVDPRMTSVMFIEMLLHDDPHDFLVKKAKKCAYVYDDGDDDHGRSTGPKYRRLDYQMEKHKAQLWFKDGPKPLLARATPDAKDFGIQFARRSGSGHGAADEMAVTFTQWKTNRKLASRLFKFRPPPGAEEVDSFNALMINEGYRPLLDEAAPSFTLDLLDGGRLNLGKHKGKEIVILDFWASWCGPCIVGLPILAEVAEEYKDKGVVFYAVNLREEMETARQFMSNAKLDCRVALDRDGKIAERFKVRGIPHTVIIDKKGVIRVVHSGLPMDLAKRIREEIEEILSDKGKDKSKRKRRP